VAAKDVSQAFIVSFGAEDYFLDRDIERALAWKDRHVIQVSGEDMDDRELVGLCETGSFDGGKRVIVLDEANRLKGDKALKAYIAAKELKDDQTVLVAVVRSEKCPAVWESAAKKGRLIEYKKLKTWDSNNEVVKWLEGEARRLGLVLAEGIANTLYQLVGANLYRLANELRKLSVLLGKEGKVGVEQVKLVIAPSPAAEPYQVADAAFAKDAKRAMNTLSTVYRVMGEEAHVPITFSLIRQIEKVVMARAMLDRKAPEEEIATALGMHPWRCKTQFLPVAQKHQMTDLIRHMGRLRKLDEDVKSQARSKRTLVELAVLKISG
jgi:DNA polymerase-3 subunit delta